MRNIGLLLALAFSVFACSHKDHSDPSGSGTRGGGDVCEIDYRAQLANALVWLKSRAPENLDPKDYERIRSIPMELSTMVSVHCSVEPIFVGDVRKTAYTEQTGISTFSTRIDPNMWFAAASSVRGGLATHEVLVMFGIEKTGDYHLSDTYLGTDISAVVGTFECRKVIWEKNEFILSLVAHDTEDYSEMAYTLSLTFNLGSSKGVPAHTNRLVVASDLNCEFSELDQNLFSCFQNHSSGGAFELVAEMADAGMVRELRVFWSALENPPMLLEEARAKVHDYKRIELDRPMEGAIVIPLGNSTLGLPLDEPGATRCKTSLVL
jgi:hypothetical protein